MPERPEITEASLRKIGAAVAGEMFPHRSKGLITALRIGFCWNIAEVLRSKFSPEDQTRFLFPFFERANVPNALKLAVYIVRINTFSPSQDQGTDEAIRDKINAFCKALELHPPPITFTNSTIGIKLVNPTEDTTSKNLETIEVQFKQLAQSNGVEDFRGRVLLWAVNGASRFAGTDSVIQKTANFESRLVMRSLSAGASQILLEGVDGLKQPQTNLGELMLEILNMRAVPLGETKRGLWRTKRSLTVWIPSK